MQMEGHLVDTTFDLCQFSLDSTFKRKSAVFLGYLLSMVQLPAVMFVLRMFSQLSYVQVTVVLLVDSTTCSGKLISLPIDTEY